MSIIAATAAPVATDHHSQLDSLYLYVFCYNYPRGLQIYNMLCLTLICHCLWLPYIFYKTAADDDVLLPRLPHNPTMYDL